MVSFFEGGVPLIVQNLLVEVTCWGLFLEFKELLHQIIKKYIYLKNLNLVESDLKIIMCHSFKYTTVIFH